MSSIRVDSSLCTRCGLCAADCPLGLIELSDDGPTPTSELEPLCIACGHCVAVCPAGALDHREMTAAACPAVTGAQSATPEDAERFLRLRRSIRRYRDRVAARPLLERLIRLAAYAPSGHNAQPIEWLAVSGRAAVAELAALVVDWMRRLATDQPATFEAMRLGRVVEAAQRGEDRVLRGAPHLLVAHAPRDNRFAPAAAVTSLAYLELAAPSLGLGTCWAGYFTAAAASFEPLRTALGLPELHTVYGAAMAGYPDVGYCRLPLRRAPKIVWREGG